MTQLQGQATKLLLLISLTALLCLPTPGVVAQAPGWQNALMGALLDSLAGSRGSSSSSKCTPFKLPQGFKNYQEYCKSLSIADDKELDNMFATAAGPMSGVFPLQGCVLGCIAGRDSYNRGMRWGSSTWSGKCIRNADVVNLLSPLPPIGGAITVLDSFNWSRFLPAMEQFPGVLSTGPSWWDAMYVMPSTGRMGSAWIITYDDVEPPAPSNNTLSEVQRAYAQLVRGTRDEVRVLSNGMMLGQVLRRPNSYLNPTPFPINSGIRFALFQVCDRRGNYANGGNQRKLG